LTCPVPRPADASTRWRTRSLPVATQTVRASGVTVSPVGAWRSRTLRLTWLAPVSMRATRPPPLRVRPPPTPRRRAARRRELRARVHLDGDGIGVGFRTGDLLLVGVGHPETAAGEPKAGTTLTDRPGPGRRHGLLNPVGGGVDRGHGAVRKVAGSMRTAWLAAGRTAGVVGVVGARPSRARRTAAARSTAVSTPAATVSTNVQRGVSQGRRPASAGDSRQTPRTPGRAGHLGARLPKRTTPDSRS
jgi:hypothetical protein